VLHRSLPAGAACKLVRGYRTSLSISGRTHADAEPRRRFQYRAFT
jgi:hypothetical protein